jgi:hypothetical protein
MKANELRIGNIVHHIGLGTSVIIELRNDGISVHNPLNKRQSVFEPNHNLHRLEPIPLSEKWLFKFKFLTESYIATGNFMIRGNKVVNIKSNRGNFDYNIIVSADDYDNWRFIVKTNPYLKDHKKEIDITLKPLKHVHQLQNLYFALTGKELTIKEAVI